MQPPTIKQPPPKPMIIPESDKESKTDTKREQNTIIILDDDIINPNGKYKNYLIYPEEGKIFSLQRNKWMKGTDNGKGYYQITINGKPELKHRVIYQYYHNTNLTIQQQIDHIDRDKNNNSIYNLRIVTNSQNNQNKSPRVDSKTGIKGVSITNSNTFSANIQYNGEREYIGTFNTAKEAYTAYEQKAITLNKTQGTTFNIPKLKKQHQPSNKKNKRKRI